MLNDEIEKKNQLEKEQKQSSQPVKPLTNSQSTQMLNDKNK